MRSWIRSPVPRNPRTGHGRRGRERLHRPSARFLGFDLSFQDSRSIIASLVAGLGLCGPQSRDSHAPLDPAQQPRFPVGQPIERIIVERESFLLNLPKMSGSWVVTTDWCARSPGWRSQASGQRVDLANNPDERAIRDIPARLRPTLSLGNSLARPGGVCGGWVRRVWRPG
jgi:hypothetical protein